MSPFGVSDSFFVFCYYFTPLFLRYLVWPFENYSRRSPVPRLSGYQYHLHVVGHGIVRALQCVNDTDGYREKCPSSCSRPLNSTRFVFNIDKHGVYNTTVQCERPRCSVGDRPSFVSRGRIYVYEIKLQIETTTMVRPLKKQTFL